MIVLSNSTRKQIYFLYSSSLSGIAAHYKLVYICHWNLYKKYALYQKLNTIVYWLIKGSQINLQLENLLS